MAITIKWVNKGNDGFNQAFGVQADLARLEDVHAILHGADGYDAMICARILSNITPTCCRHTKTSSRPTCCARLAPASTNEWKQRTRLTRKMAATLNKRQGRCTDGRLAVILCLAVAPNLVSAQMDRGRRC